MRLRVLVTGAGALLGQGIIKSLRLAGADYEVIAVDPDARAVGLYWADLSYLVPGARDPAYLDAIRRILRLERPDAVLIGTDVELSVFAHHRAELEQMYGTRIIVSSPEVIRTADDKYLTYQFLASHGLPCPRTALPGGVDDLLRLCGYPLIVKPRVGARSVDVQIVRTPQGLSWALGRVDNAVVQELVGTESEEFTSGVLVVDDRAQAVVTMRRDLKDGNTYRAYIEDHSRYDDFLMEVARKLTGGFGALNFQFRVVDGVPKIFEINARFSGTTPLRAYAGFNEVHHLLRWLFFGDPIPRPLLRRAVVLRFWDEIIIDEPTREGAGDEWKRTHLDCERPFGVLRFSRRTPNVCSTALASDHGGAHDL